METPNLLSPSFYADIDTMHDAFRTMRAEGPVWRDEVNELWAVVHHAPLIDVERRADVFSSKGCYRSRVAPQEEDMIAKDDPEHHAQRAFVARRFTPKARAVIKLIPSDIGRPIADLQPSVAVPGLDQARFSELAESSKKNCPLSKALASVPEISLQATLNGG